MALELTTLGVGAANSPRYAPAGLLVERPPVRLMIDGGPGSVPGGPLDAWLVTDERAELMPAIRRIAGARGAVPAAAGFAARGLAVDFRPVVHTNHETGGYLIEADGRRVAWAPEFWEFPAWAAGVDLMFAEASGWSRPIRFRGGAGGHMPVVAVAEAAKLHGVRRLVFAHIGRPAIQAMDRGERPAFGEFARDGQVFRLRARRPAR